MRVLKACKVIFAILALCFASVFLYATVKCLRMVWSRGGMKALLVCLLLSCIPNVLGKAAMFFIKSDLPILCGIFGVAAAAACAWFLFRYSYLIKLFLIQLGALAGIGVACYFLIGKDTQASTDAASTESEEQTKSDE